MTGAQFLFSGATCVHATAACCFELQSKNCTERPRAVSEAKTACDVIGSIVAQTVLACS